MKRVATSVDIHVAPRVVFDVLTDFAAYPEWCPFFARVRGRASVGSPLEFDVAGEKPRTMRAKLVELVPARRVAWSGGLPLGLFRGVHSFDIEPGPGGSTVHDIEQFQGPIAALMLSEARLAQQREGFIAFDAALKHRCEQLADVAA